MHIRTRPRMSIKEYDNSTNSRWCQRTTLPKGKQPMLESWVTSWVRWVGVGGWGYTGTTEHKGGGGSERAERSLQGWMMCG